jgi:hypothetical protein
VLLAWEDLDLVGRWALSELFLQLDLERADIVVE